MCSTQMTAAHSGKVLPQGGQRLPQPYGSGQASTGKDRLVAMHPYQLWTTRVRAAMSPSRCRLPEASTVMNATA